MLVESRNPARPTSARSHTTTSGLLLAAALLPLSVVEEAHGPWPSLPLSWRVLTGVLIGALMVAGLTVPYRPRQGRWLAAGSVLGVLGLGAPRLAESPSGTLAAVIAVILAVAGLFGFGPLLLGSLRPLRRSVLDGRTQGAAIGALGLWLFWSWVGPVHTGFEVAVVGWAMALCVVTSLLWIRRNWRFRNASARVVLAALLVSAGVIPLVWGRPWLEITSGLTLGAVAAFGIRRGRRTGMDQGGWWEPLAGRPERLFVGTFAGLSLAGTVLLALPYSAASGTGIGLMDAAFTSTSAVCVTGLIVLDTPVAFSSFGQVVILLLIQVGGLGVMTFSTVALWALGRRISLRHEGVLASLISTQDRSRLVATARGILLFTLATEAVGALLLLPAFIAGGDGFGEGLWRAVFTSVSAFCNAGFALQSDSLVAYQQSPLVLHVVALLIIAGGLSPLTVFALPSLVARSPRPVSAQIKLGLVGTGVLLGLGFVLVLAFEWGNSLGHLPVMARLNNAWFQSVTLRTAGFNSTDLSSLKPATVTLMMLWMFIGGNPGGTAGGVKTTTVAVLLLSVFEIVRGRPTLEAFGKLVPERTRSRAAVTVTVAALVVVGALIAMQLTQAMSTELAAFEVVSALGTVGLSLGATGLLDGTGKAIIIVCMFAGRVGGLTLLTFLSSPGSVPAVGRPEEELDVG